MALKLTVTSPQCTALGARASIVFGVGGGSIGRGHDNDWVLPDPQRYLSAHHARIQFRSGSYFLLDTSSNGVFVNDATVAIGRRNTYPLRDGDRLRLGDYEIGVGIDATAIEAPEASAIFPMPDASAHAGGVPADIGASLELRDLLRRDPSPSTSGRIGPVDAFGQPAFTEDPGLLAFDHSGQRPAPTRVLTASPAAARKSAGATEARATLEGATPFEAFCRGAGIDVHQLAAEAQARLLHLSGQLLREALVGLKGLALAQREMRAEEHIDVGREDPQRIGLTGLPVEHLLLRLLLGHGQHEIDAVQWLRDTLGSTRRHDAAIMRALQVALIEFVARLEPRALALGGLERTAPAGAEAESSGLTARFRSITEMPSGRLPHLFSESFARAFASEFSRGNDPGKS